MYGASYDHGYGDLSYGDESIANYGQGSEKQAVTDRSRSQIDESCKLRQHGTAWFPAGPPSPLSWSITSRSERLLLRRQRPHGPGWTRGAGAQRAGFADVQQPC